MPTALTDNEQQALLQIARASVSATIGTESYRPAKAAGGLMVCAGAFVTLRLNGELRGCIGYIERDRPLVEVIARCAAAAATEDPRFSPLTADELTYVRVEISVLGPLERFTDPREVEVGRHGVVVQVGLRRGLLLPQVAIEWHWDRHTFLAQTCLKAGLAPDAWRTGAELYRFEALVFGEDDTTPVRY
jgi:AmmeMemoRadiSam system protein A